MATSKKQTNTGLRDKDVQEALLLLGRNAETHNTNVTIWRLIQELFTFQFDINNKDGSKTISSKLLLQILWKVAGKMKIPDFKVHRAGPFKMSTNKKEMEFEANKRDLAEKFVTAGVATVMKEGRFNDCMRNKGGVFYKTALYGDCHLSIGYDEDNSDYPIAFRVVSLSDYYTNNKATDLRDVVGGLSSDGEVKFFRYTKDQFNELWPKFKDKVPAGEIPRNFKDRKQLEKTWNQDIREKGDEIEVAVYTSISKVQVIFAGPAAVILKKYKGDMKKEDKEKLEKGESIQQEKSFPYLMDNKPYLPTLHYKFFPSSEGYYNYGIGHMVFDIALLAAKMDNMAYRHAVDNVYPINFVNTPNKGASRLFKEILKAQKMRDAGGSAYVVSENRGGGSGVTVEPFQSAPITNEWERAFNRLEQNITRMGFRLDAPDLGANPNEMSIMAEQESTDAPIKQVIEWNASEFEMAINITMDFIRKFVPDDDETPLNTMLDLDIGAVNLPMRGIPLGWVAKELRANKYFVVVNSRDGTIPSGVMQEARLSRVQNTLAPGSPGWNKINMQRAELHGIDISEDEMAMSAPVEMPTEGSPGAAGEPKTTPIQTETTPADAVALKRRG